MSLLKKNCNIYELKTKLNTKELETCSERAIVNKTWFYIYVRVISRAPGLKIVVETLISSLKPIGNIVLIAATFFIIFGILGVQVNISERQ